MAEALSQSQIDDLLKKMQSGGDEEEKAPPKPKHKEYDFSSPKKFTKDQLKSLSTLYENYSRMLASYFTGMLRSICEIQASQMEELRYYEYYNSLPDNTLVAVIGIEPKDPSFDPSSVIIEFPTSFGFLVVERLMGATGKPHTPDRDFTEIELGLLNMVIKSVSNFLQEAWSNFFELDTKLMSVETNGRLLQAYSQQDIIVITSMDISEPFYSGTINMCVLAEGFVDIINSLNVKYTYVTKAHDEAKEAQKKEIVFGYINESEINMEAVLDNFVMPVNDLAFLQPGDVIALDKKIDSEIEIFVEGIPWSSARIGESDNKKAVKLVDIHEKRLGE